MIAERSDSPLGRYTLTKRLAVGGMAEVWLAHSGSIDSARRRLVLKVLLPELAEDPDCVRMFVDEARLAAQLDHPNIVKILDVGQSQGRFFIAMEYVAGKTLRQVIQRLRREKNALPGWFVFSVGAKACDALEYAHAKRDMIGKPLNIVHRDVSPENIMVAYDGTVKVLDFGIAKASSRATRTHVGVMKGKHAYMSPEQILVAETGCAVDHRADLYSLGIVLYEMLTSERPFTADNELGLIRSIVERTSDPDDAATLAPWLDKEVGAIVQKAMAREPGNRFQSASEMHDALTAQLRSRGYDASERHVGTMLSLIFRAEADERGRMRDSMVPTSGLWPATKPPDPRDLSVRAVTDGRKGRKELRTTLKDVDARAPFESESGEEAVTLAGVRQAVAQGTTQTVPACVDPESLETDVQPEAVQHHWDAVLAKVRQHKDPGSQPPSAPDVPEPDSRRAAPKGERAAPKSERSGPKSERSNSVPPPTPQSQARIEFERGLDLLRAKDRLGARVALERAVELDPASRLYQSNLRLLNRQIEESDR